jgi:hypothetical protein
MSVIDPHLHEALTDLHLYVLVVDAERQRIAQRLESLGGSSSDDGTRAELERQHAAIVEELDALRSMLIALRLRVDPAGTTV